MNITMVMLVLNQKELTQKFLDQLRSVEGTFKMPLFIVDNGSTEPIRDWLVGLRDGDEVLRLEENAGVMPAMNKAWGFLKDRTDYMFFIHNDVMVYEQNWSDKMLRILSGLPDCGVSGFYGAKGIGVPGIYRTPYVMQQLVRIQNVSGCTRMNAAVHGFRNPRAETEEVAVMDGFSLCVRTELLNKLGGFDRSYPQHHNYDNDICLESMDKGYKNYVISMDADHLGGRTDVGEDWAKAFGKTKAEIHRDAHPVLYNKWKPEFVANGTHKICLPIRIP